MNGEQCATVIGQLLNQLGSRFHAEVRAATCQVVTPFLYPDNTPIAIDVIPVGESRFLLSDGGEAADYAFVNGVGISSLKDRISKVEHRFDINTVGQELSIEVAIDDLGHGLTTLVNGVQDIGYLVYRRAPRRPSARFQDEVERYLATGQHPFESKVTVAGATGPKTIDCVQGSGGAGQLYLMTFEPSSTAGTLSRAKVVAYNVRDILLGHTA